MKLENVKHDTFYVTVPITHCYFLVAVIKENKEFRYKLSVCLAVIMTTETSVVPLTP